MAKKKRMSQSQIALGVIMIATILLGYGAVAYIVYAYETDSTPSLLFESDSDMTFWAGSYGDTYPEYGDYYASPQTCQKGYDSGVSGSHMQWNRTPVFSGNNTWSMSVNSTGLNHNFAEYYIALPNLDSWVVSSVNLTMSKNTDSDIALFVIFGHNNGVLEQGDVSMSTGIYTNYGVGSTSGTEYSTNIEVAPANALRIYDFSQVATETFIVLQYMDADFDGIGAFAWDINLEIWGDQINDWSLSDSIFSALAGATGLNIFIGLVATDSIDIGGFVRDLPKRRK